MAYKSGVISASSVQKLTEKFQSLAERTNISDKKIEDYGLSWDSVSHAITIIGWGFDEKSNQKYWILRNSYGQRWGDKGNLMIQRGKNDFALEVEATAFEPILCEVDGC